MLPIDRRRQIIELLRDKRSASVKDLSEHFSVTTETIRRDLKRLEKENLLTSVYGGAYMDTVQQNAPISMRKETMRKEKEQIASLCLDLIENGDTIMLDSSTTAYYLAKKLINIRKITVITNSIEIAQLFSYTKSVDLICLGGRLNDESQAFMDCSTLESVNKYFADKGFISCTGISIDSGLTDSLEMQGQIRKAMLEHSQKRICIADHTKIGKTTLSKIMQIDKIDGLVTDRAPSFEWMNELEKRKIECLYPKDS